MLNILERQVSVKNNNFNDDDAVFIARVVISGPSWSSFWSVGISSLSSLWSPFHRSSSQSDKIITTSSRHVSLKILTIEKNINPVPIMWVWDRWLMAAVVPCLKSYRHSDYRMIMMTITAIFARLFPINESVSRYCCIVPFSPLAVQTPWLHNLWQIYSPSALGIGLL